MPGSIKSYIAERDHWKAKAEKAESRIIELQSMDTKDAQENAAIKSQLLEAQEHGDTNRTRAQILALENARLTLLIAAKDHMLRDIQGILRISKDCSPSKEDK